MIKRNNKPFIHRYLVIGLHYYQNYDFTFDHQTNILVGESGLGKTKILHLLYLTLTKRWITLAKQQFDFISVWFDEDNYIEFSKGELEFYLLLTYEDVSFGAQKKAILEKFSNILKIIKSNVKSPIIYFPVYRDLKDDLGVIGKRFSDARYPEEFTSEEIIEASSIEKDILIPLSLEELFYGKRSFKTKELQCLITLCNSYLLGIRLTLSDKLKVMIINNSTNDIVGLTQLSSGEKQLVYFFFKVFFSETAFAYILFDEPELSIPIDWQRRLLLDLKTLKKDAFVLTITHSPFIFDNNLDLFTTGINIYKA
jgi:energy-coupling factor transporter ATP-binding protein EcfA2